VQRLRAGGADLAKLRSRINLPVLSRLRRGLFRLSDIRATDYLGARIGLVPIFLSTLAIGQQTPRITFESAARMLDMFAMQQGGTQYRRLVAAFQRIFAATIFFGSNTQRERSIVVQRDRFNFMSEARIWYSRDPDQKLLPGDC
jgi:hypothetical protein